MEHRATRWILGAALIAVTIAAFFGVRVAHSDDGVEPDTAQATIATSVNAPNVAVYRLSNPSSGEHLYTADARERTALATSHGWSDEGVGWYAPHEGATGIYRIYNPNDGRHLFTTDTNECAQLSSRGWQMDNGGAPLFYSGGDVPILRLYMPSTGEHLNTKDTNEYTVLPGRGWTPEGIKFYGMSAATSTVNWPMGSADISTATSQHSIASTVTLTGAGSGYEAKLVADGGDGAVSFGLAYDDAAAAPYGGACALLIENVVNNAPVESKLVYGGFGEAGKALRLMLTVQNDGIVDCYVNGERVKSVKNDRLAFKTLDLRVESAGKAVGDTVTATFDNLQLKRGGVYQGNEQALWQPSITAASCGLTPQIGAFPQTVTISGAVSALADSTATTSHFRGVGTVALR